MTISANGIATVDGVRLTWQEIDVTGDNDTISEIKYGEYTVRAVKEEFDRLLRRPESYYAVPQYPEPMTMKAAIVAIYTLFDSESVIIDGKVEDDEASEGVIY